MFNFNLVKKNILNRFNNNFQRKFNNRCSRFVGEYKVVKQEELQTFLDNDVCILDVRTQNEFKGVRVKNAINMPINVLNREILSIVPDKDTKILIYCSTGERTMAAIQKLNNLEYLNLYIWGNGGLNTLKCKDILEY